MAAASAVSTEVCIVVAAASRMLWRATSRAAGEIDEAGALAVME